MTVLTVAKNVAKNIGIAEPTELYSATDREVVELRDQIEKTADRIAEGHDWQLFSTIGTLTGDGSAEAFDLPSDYDRMATDAEVWSSALESPLTHISSQNRWLGLDIQSFDFIINAWILYGGQLQIKPALANTVTAQFFYQSNLIVEDSAAATKAQFTADDDVYRLDEGLLELGCIWEWKSNKGQSYAEYLETFEEKKERLVNRDRGARIVRIGRARFPSDVNIAYPQTIVG